MENFEPQYSSPGIITLSDEDLLQVTGGASKTTIVDVKTKTDVNHHGFLWLNKTVKKEITTTYADGRTTTTRLTNEIKSI
jgi:hypothetical protein